MKNLLSLSVLAMFIGILSSCNMGNSKDTKLQNPTAKVSNEKQMTPDEAKAKTMADLQEAFKGETTASAKYAAYSQKAEQDGFHNIALLFKAASTAEKVHANNHKSVMVEYGVAIPEFAPEFTVKSTAANLQDAIDGESYEIATMYPDFLKDAGNSKSQLAQITFNYALEVEKKHQIMYKNALAALDNNSVNELPQVYYICPTCGNTYDQTPPERCGISMTSSEKFLKINSL
ncbi:rubrerythrin family protein [Labilibaculum antarcticum]|uniref:Rubrerythrin n=1 Tax=Labilibaculum antarcticum TaxID=1717717 RepID=A0A1Y1CN25_9BACT|nr:ferritin family protein [Labilibaculum antarcticum]BAX81674.1 rubrerythrin [Labilibaculum antarcticum]